VADVSATFASLSSTEGSNSPSGSTSVGTNLAPNLRMIEAHQAAARDASGWFGLKLTSVAGTNSVTASVASQGSITMAPTAYATGQRFHLIPANSNTGAAVINISTLGNKSIFLNGAALVGYEMRKNCPVVLEYDGTQLNIIAGAHGGDGNPLGSILPYSGTSAPNGFLLCFGQAVSRTTYADLFGLVSTTYGVGDGSSTFNLPDLRGRAPFGKDDMGGSAASRVTAGVSGITGTTLGAAGGDQNSQAHAHTTDAQGSHAHAGSTVAVDSVQGGTPGGGSAGVAGDGAVNTTVGLSITSDGSHAHNVSSSGSGSSQNMPPALILNYIIKT